MFLVTFSLIDLPQSEAFRSSQIKPTYLFHSGCKERSVLSNYNINSTNVFSGSVVI